MGDVDLAGMQQLHCNATVLVLNKWWLKLFSYLLGVVSSNDLVIYRLSINNEYMNIANFRLSLVGLFVGKCINSAPHSPKEVKHQLVFTCMNNTVRCLVAYFYLFYKNYITQSNCKYPE